ncbi:hypothetical protein [Planktothrix mougeotii]|uniref:Uncharacterized protein n=1 Tax=Planktothrix mougeotii LEGE 06226 TaxID=1828728 RepID=A0ABR9UBI6_9CYAN|nr:hypothetical protein [Planktothrix mougeotii]MBE9143161.1 hypothetical protein [Planktothrix mougeotii LEGE 06226]
MKLKNNRFLKLIVWIFTEILLNFLGLDDLADYSEFLFEKTVYKPRVVIAEFGFNLGLNEVQNGDEHFTF